MTKPDPFESSNQPVQGMNELKACYEDRENASAIPCPFLVTAYNNRWLNPSADGSVTKEAIRELLARVGLDSTIQNVLAKAADQSDEHLDEKFNLFTLKQSNLSHTGSTGVREIEGESSEFKNEVERRLQEMLLNFSKDGRLYDEQFAAAANHAQIKDPGLKGTLIQSVEFTALLEVFGRVDESGKHYLTNADVRRLWIDGRLPENWTPRDPANVTALKVAFSVLSALWKRIWR